MRDTYSHVLRTPKRQAHLGLKPSSSSLDNLSWLLAMIVCKQTIYKKNAFPRKHTHTQRCAKTFPMACLQPMPRCHGSWQSQTKGEQKQKQKNDSGEVAGARRTTNKETTQNFAVDAAMKAEPLWSTTATTPHRLEPSKETNLGIPDVFLASSPSSVSSSAATSLHCITLNWSVIHPLPPPSLPYRHHLSPPPPTILREDT